MNYLTMFGMALALAMDAFAVSIGAGLKIPQVTPRAVFRIAFHFGLFQFLMPVVGWFAGKDLAAQFGSIDHWIAFTLLALVGGKMISEAWDDEKLESKVDPTRGMMLVTLSIATSIDALAVGMSLAFLHVSIWIPSIVIGIITAALSTLGIIGGGRLGRNSAPWAEVAGGCALILIGTKILLSHLFS